MALGTKHIATLLRNAREKKGLSQRELSALSGVRQSQISKIEQGAVDLRLTSLIELARALDLELTLVPSPAVPAVQSIVRSSAASSGSEKESRLSAKYLNKLQEAVANHLSDLPHAPEELPQLQRNLRELQHFHLSKPDQDEIRNAYKTFQRYFSDHKDETAVRNTFARLRSLRNMLAHRAATPSAPEAARPAYTLDEDDNG